MDKDDATKYNKYGNFYIEDATGKVYVYGLVRPSAESPARAYSPIWA